MLSLIFKFLFCLTSAILAGMTIYGKLFIFKKKHPQVVSDYAATMAGLIGLYALTALGLVFILPFVSSKFIMLGFAISPFLIGLLTTYHSEKYFTLIQIALFLLSILYVLK